MCYYLYFIWYWLGRLKRSFRYVTFIFSNRNIGMLLYRFFKNFGFSEDESKIITDVLLTSDKFGIESHGMQRISRYHKGIQKGLIKVDAVPEVIFETPVTAVLDAHDGMGQLVAYKAMNMAIEKAKKVVLQL